MLAFYASRLNTVEVNYTFRTLPTEAQLTGWLAQTGPGFRFSFKAPQRITHFARLRACEAQLDAFFAAIQPAARAKKLGLVLFQLPPNLKADPVRLADFLAAPAFRRGPRIAFEFRHESWFTAAIYTLLRRANAALCIADTDDLLTPEVHTARTHTCFRLRQDGGYTAPELAAFAARHTALAAAGRTVYTHFRHQEAPTGALNAAEYLSLAAAAQEPRA